MSFKVVLKKKRTAATAKVFSYGNTENIFSFSFLDSLRAAKDYSHPSGSDKRKAFS